MYCWLILLALTAPVWSQTYEVSATKDVMIPARDGIKLATDIYRPARNGAAVGVSFRRCWNALHRTRALA